MYPILNCVVPLELTLPKPSVYHRCLNLNERKKRIHKMNYIQYAHPFRDKYHNIVSSSNYFA